MTVTVEMHNTGDPGIRAEVVATIEHVLSDRLGDWRVLRGQLGEIRSYLGKSKLSNLLLDNAPICVDFLS